MKRWSNASAVCSILAIMLLFSVSACSAKEKSAPAPKTEGSSDDNDSAVLSGKVVETMNAGGYTYVCLEKKGVKTWLAIPQTEVTVGKVMAFQPGMEMTNFTSKSLNRTFKSIYFSGGLLNASKGNGEMSAPGMYGGSAGSSGEKISVKKAEGKEAYTVAEIYSKKTSLNEKQVVVRGKVVKVSSGIMGKNWIHLQDGTGNAESGTNDIIATSQDSPGVGEIVTVKGTVYKDKDFGAGYKYSVIMEQASVEK
ncbi:MAG TPA: DNA-binding protein [Nitrospirota bacterium]|nr:DNA-binding protein [Nitrospirota bacterium]